MSRAHLPGRVLLIAALAALSACSKIEPPVAPELVAPWVPPDVEVTPPIRARWVPESSIISARWDVPLDPLSINSTTVYLKIDARRYNAFFAFADSGRRLIVTPAASLLLARTYTVEITPRVLRADGQPLYPNGWFWQFTITSIRDITTPDPPNDDINVSPFMRLRWNATPAQAGPVAFTLFRGNDSSAVTRRSVPGLVTDGNRWVPTAHWDYNRMVYWGIRAINQKTGQVYESSTFHFRPVAVNAPVDSVYLRAQYWGYSLGAPGSNPDARCNTNPFMVGPTTWAAIRWLPPNTNRKFHHIRWFIQGNPTWLCCETMSLRAIPAEWDPCAVLYQTRPLPSGPVLATMERGEGNAYLFRSEAWTAHFEAGMRDQNLYGYMIASGRDVGFNLFNPRDPTLGALVLYYYK